MADTQEPQRSLWLRVLWTPTLAYWSMCLVLILLVVVPASYFEWPPLTVLMGALGVWILYAASVWVSLAWDRERPPLPPPDE